ncbi:carbohydrate binding-domain-containing protein [Mycena maculata]|uniref:Carbohydrate binding-domain-containing protein n=1 Tax=Mycena maculata TaxID=230809 RepID=A0AAD7INF6_9AGAR|nr:carbohydrate binding-domain-containing protein [Mycena maculata]
MAQLLPIVLTALAACSIVAAEDLVSCGASNYYPSQYTCFDDDFLCPIVNGTAYIQCGDACYSDSQYSCNDTTLGLYNPNGPNPLDDCGFTQYDPSQYICFDGFSLCPIMDGSATFKCGDVCYTPDGYSCSLGQVYPNGTPQPTCVPDFGDDELCTEDGCEILPCCPGLISVADKCRDPCQLDPSSCPSRRAE